ncbi:MerR family transcriptional regulator [Providencia rettgeri]|uniref:MerR family transcriptional regulator n=1 Tax=Providencia rettgeri TaxID=587 RepID=UPI0034E094D1
MNYSISQFSKLTGFTLYTLRYYEKEGLLKPSRQSNNHRFYSDTDVEWIQFISRLKDTGMPLKKIKEYATLRERGESTVFNRMNILTEHSTNLEKQISSLNEHLNRLNLKILYYKEQIKK